MNKQKASPNDELAELADAYRESVERLYSAIELAAIRQMAEDETIRIEMIGRYRYSIVYKHATNGYYMRCVDTERPRNTMDHGPYSLEKCHAEIDRRVHDAEEKKR